MSWVAGKSCLFRYFERQLKIGPSAILNPKGRHYDLLKKTWAAEYEDNYWPEDAIFLERNSRDFVSRIERVNGNAEAICEVLMKHPKGMPAAPRDMESHC